MEKGGVQQRYYKGGEGEKAEYPKAIAHREGGEESTRSIPVKLLVRNGIYLERFSLFGGSRSH